MAGLNEFQPWNHNCSSSLCTEWPPYLNDSLHAAAFFHYLMLPSDCLIMKAICSESRWSEHKSLGVSRTAICHALTLLNMLPLHLSRKWWRRMLSIRNLPEWNQISPVHSPKVCHLLGIWTPHHCNDKMHMVSTPQKSRQMYNASPWAINHRNWLNVLSSYHNPMRVRQYSSKKMYTLQTKKPI